MGTNASTNKKRQDSPRRDDRDRTYDVPYDPTTYHNPQPHRRELPPQYRPIVQPLPPPIYHQHIRQRPYCQNGYCQPAPPPPPEPRGYPYPRIQRVQPRPRVQEQPYVVPYVVQPLVYVNTLDKHDVDAVHGPKAKPQDEHVLTDVQTLDKDATKMRLYHEVQSMISYDMKKTKMKEEKVITDETKTKKEKDDDDYIGANLRFYRNEIRYRPSGEYIENIHKYWFGDYDRLEKTHTYIQWLFPISETSRVNQDAIPLRQHETNFFTEDLEIRARLIKSYRLMLDFYGLSLINEDSGKVERSHKWKDRFYVFKGSVHNHYRITRIIRSLGELGLPHYQAPLVMCLFHEIFETGELHGVSPPTVYHWLRTIENPFDRSYVYHQFQEKILKLEDDLKAAQQHEAEMYYYETFPKRRKDYSYNTYRKSYRAR